MNNYTNYLRFHLGEDLKCPVCGKDVYISEESRNFACKDVNCEVGHGFNEWASKLMFKAMWGDEESPRLMGADISQFADIKPNIPEYQPNGFPTHYKSTWIGGNRELLGKRRNSIIDLSSEERLAIMQSCIQKTTDKELDFFIKKLKEFDESK